MDGNVVNACQMPRCLTVAIGWVETFNVGIDTGTPMDADDHQMPFRFIGKLGPST